MVKIATLDLTDSGLAVRPTYQFSLPAQTAKQLVKLAKSKDFTVAIAIKEPTLSPLRNTLNQLKMATEFEALGLSYEWASGIWVDLQSWRIEESACLLILSGSAPSKEFLRYVDEKLNAYSHSVLIRPSESGALTLYFQSGLHRPSRKIHTDRNVAHNTFLIECVRSFVRWLSLGRVKLGDVNDC